MVNEKHSTHKNKLAGKHTNKLRDYLAGRLTQ